MKSRPGLQRALTVILITAAFGFLAAEIVRNLEQLRSFDWNFDPGLLLASLVALSAVFFAGIAIWGFLLRRFGVEARLLPLARAWFLSNLSRYVPGVVWQFVSLAQLGGGAGLTPQVAVTSLLLQMGFMLLGAVLVGVFLLPVELAGPLTPALSVLRWLTPLGMLAASPAAIRLMLRAVQRLTNKPTLEWRGTWGTGLWLLFLALAEWVAYGAAFFLFVRAFVPLPLSLLPAVIAINALAFVVGYLAFFAPGGLGFKEATLGVLLAGLMPAGVAASLAVAARLWTMLAEVVPAIVLIRGRRPREDLPRRPAAPGSVGPGSGGSA